MTSRHPDDFRNGYCGKCHAYLQRAPIAPDDAEHMQAIENVARAAVSGTLPKTQELLHSLLLEAYGLGRLRGQLDLLGEIMDGPQQ